MTLGSNECLKMVVAAHSSAALGGRLLQQLATFARASVEAFFFLRVGAYN